MKAKKKSQRRLADELGISTTAMTAICNNKSQPHLKDLKKIAKILDVDIKDLLISIPASPPIVKPHIPPTSQARQRVSLPRPLKSKRFVSKTPR